MRLDRGRSIRIAARVSLAILALIVVFELAGYFVAPGLVKSTAQSSITEATGRKATIGAVRFNPFRLALTVDEFRLYETDGTTVALQIDELVANVSSASLWKRAIVFDELHLTRLHLQFARLEARHYSFSDIVDRILAQPKSDSPTRFSVNNIRLDDGSIDFDDRVTGRRHHIDDIRIGLPFVSNLPHDVEIFVTPALAARVNGSPLELTGKVQPFSPTRESAIALEITDLDLKSYVDFVPLPIEFRIASGLLGAKLGVSFKAGGADANAAPSIDITGNIGLKDLALTDRAGRGIAGLAGLDVAIAHLDPIGPTIALQSVAIVGPRVEATRRPDGSIDLATIFAAPSGAPSSQTAAPTPAFSIADFRLQGGSVRFVDRIPHDPVTTDLKDIDVKATAIALTGDAPIAFAVSAGTGDGARLEVTGQASASHRTSSGTLSVQRLRPAVAMPYLTSLMAARIEDGIIDASARYRFDASGDAVSGGLDGLSMRIEKLRTRLPDDKAAFFAADAIALDGGAVDFGKRSFVAETLKLTAPAVRIARDAKGKVNLQTILVEARPVAAPSTKAAVAVVPAAAPPFVATLKHLTIERGALNVEDASLPTPVRFELQPFELSADNLGTAAAAVIPFEFAGTVAGRGKLAIKGKVTPSPLAVDATVEAKGVPVGWAAAYAGDRLNVVVQNADLDARGNVRVQTPAAGPMVVAYRGSAAVTDMRVVDRQTSDEFVRWNSLDLPSVDFQMPARNAPLALTLGKVGLSDFYARLIINADGHLNLQNVVASQVGNRSVTTPDAEGEAPVRRASPAPVSTAARPLFRFGTVTLSSGRIGITDNFVKPNYSANLTDLEGSLSSIASDDPKPSDVHLTGRIDGDGSLDIGGRINPLGATLYTDIAAKASDIELTRLTPYAVKYAGYAIERGKLSMTLHYHIENGRLEAANQLFLDQLTFGERVDSPTATRLPVLLAVALLKNSRGEINVDLPVSGSLSDPQFSVGGVILKLIGNLIARAVLSPFSLLASAGGGTSEELGYVSFPPGVSELSPEAKKRLDALAKALAARPGLKLDIIGRYDASGDPEGIRRDRLLDRLKDLKAKDVSKSGPKVERNDVVIDGVATRSGEYATLLARVYDDTRLPDKPRNLVGLAKTIPIDEMEKLLLADIKLDDNDPRWLAEARADVVRHYIEDTGEVSRSRVFLVTPRLDPGQPDEKGLPARVDFALR